MKKRLLSMLALLCMAVTASAEDAPTYSLSAGTSEHGTITFTVKGQAATAAAEGDEVTVTITPATGWDPYETWGVWSAAVVKAPQRRVAPNIDMLKDFELTPVEGQTNQWTFKMKRANATISASYRKLLTNVDITVEAIEDQSYTGQELTPKVVVKDGETTLVEDEDYTLSYADNTYTALATAAEKAPTVIITAVATSELYAGETTKTFTILADKSALEQGISDATDFYNFILAAYPKEAATLLESIDAAQGVDDTYAATQKDVDDALEALNQAVAIAREKTMDRAIMPIYKGNRWGTFVTNFDFPKPAKVDIYTVDGVEDNGTTLKLTALTDEFIPAYTPVLTYDPLNKEQRYTEDGLVKPYKDPVKGLLTGVLKDTEAQLGTYVLQNQNGEVAFYLVKDKGLIIPANKAYLTMPGSSVKKFSFPEIEDDETTAIAAYQVLTSNSYDSIYNAAGQKVNGLQKGMNIVVKGGKSYKIYVK